MPSAKGSCVCGKYTFEYTGTSFDTTICHCRPCAKYYNNESVNLFTDKADYKVLSGSEITATRKGDSGKDVINHCCDQCLAVMWTDVEAMRPKMIIKVGTFDDPAIRDKLKPVAEIFCRNVPENFPLLPNVPHFEGAPPS